MYKDLLCLRTYCVFKGPSCLQSCVRYSKMELVTCIIYYTAFEFVTTGRHSPDVTRESLHQLLRLTSGFSCEWWLERSWWQVPPTGSWSFHRRSANCIPVKDPWCLQGHLRSMDENIRNFIVMTVSIPHQVRNNTRTLNALSLVYYHHGFYGYRPS